MLLQREPAAPLSGHVELLWYYEGRPTGTRTERVLPNGRFQIVIDLTAGAGVVIGLRSRYSTIDAGRFQSMVGVVFRPGGARLLLAPPADAFFNRAVSLDAVWGPRTAELVARLCEARGAAKLCVLEDELRTRLEPRRTLHAAVRHGLITFDRIPHVERVLEVAKDAGLSRRRFAELFRAQVGTTPKLYCRLRRFQAVVRESAAGTPVEWARVAAAGGYSDQAHLSREFQEFAGLSPSAWLAASRPSLNHVVVR